MRALRILAAAVLLLAIGTPAQADHHKWVGSGMGMWGHTPRSGFQVTSWENHTSVTSCAGGCAVTSGTIAPVSGHAVTVVVTTIYSTAQTAATITPPGGFPAADGTPAFVNTRDEMWIYEITAGASDTSYSFTFTFSTGTLFVGIRTIDWLGVVTPTSTLDAISAYTGFSVTQTPAAPTVTSVADRDVILSCWANGNTRINAISGGSPLLTTALLQTTAAPFEGCAYGLQNAHGLTTGATATMNVSASNGQSVTLALKHS